jgi:hypothetical protein
MVRLHGERAGETNIEAPTKEQNFILKWKCIINAPNIQKVKIKQSRNTPMEVQWGEDV